MEQITEQTGLKEPILTLKVEKGFGVRDCVEVFLSEGYNLIKMWRSYENSIEAGVSENLEDIKKIRAEIHAEGKRAGIRLVAPRLCQIKWRGYTYTHKGLNFGPEPEISTWGVTKDNIYVRGLYVRDSYVDIDGKTKSLEVVEIDPGKSKRIWECASEELKRRFLKRIGNRVGTGSSQTSGVVAFVIDNGEKLEIVGIATWTRNENPLGGRMIPLPIESNSPDPHDLV